MDISSRLRGADLAPVTGNRQQGGTAVFEVFETARSFLNRQKSELSQERAITSEGDLAGARVAISPLPLLSLNVNSAEGAALSPPGEFCVGQQMWYG